jgi:hypothetical protein
VIGYIDADGKYVKGKKAPASLSNDVSSMYKQWDHDDQRRRFSGDLVQPYVDGKPNREFVDIYRDDTAKDYFSQEQIDAADRNLGGL